jgi:hypothetical protein
MWQRSMFSNRRNGIKALGNKLVDFLSELENLFGCFHLTDFGALLNFLLKPVEKLNKRSSVTDLQTLLIIGQQT